MKKTVMVEGMTCNHCERAVKESLRELSEVLDVKVDLVDGRVEVTGDNLIEKRLKEAIGEAGYEVKSMD